MAQLHIQHAYTWKFQAFHKCSSTKKLRCRFSCTNSHFIANKVKRAYTSVLIVPTGVGASIGGFAGDALPVARALASVVDSLISHPNVLNAAMLYWPMPNVLYVEGYALDKFAQGLWALQPVHQNKVADAVRASLGLPVLEYTVTDKPMGIEKWIDMKSGQSTGRIKHPDSLLRAVQRLVDQSQVNAVAVVGRFPDEDEDSMSDYRQGIGVDALAGVESIISHLVVKEFQIPCAHAPALLPIPLSQILAPKSAAEEIGYTFLPCVLAGLSNAPQYIVTNSQIVERSCIFASDVDSIILPADTFAGSGVRAFANKKINKPLIVAVEENTTVLRDTPDRLNIKTVNVSNYWEAIGVIAAHKAGIDPYSLRKNRIDNIPFRSSSSTNGTMVVRG
ncbi:uncharacterized protein LOC141657477 isoform X2 [Silene latifolia]|uniref:uncharacterized protein LOC141657477 isoform X2 n=1 Tax=Silene latifolia TaxID=37657 RepID=UPI003D771131